MATTHGQFARRARILEDGQVVAKSGSVLAVQRQGDFHYNISFNRDMTHCAAVVTANYFSATPFETNVHGYVTQNPANPNLLIAVFQEDDTSNRPSHFSLIAVCA